MANSATMKVTQIRWMTFLLTAVGVAVLLGVIFLTSWGMLMGGFLKLEENALQRNIARSQEIISDRLDHLADKLSDWGVGDDVYAFVENKNMAYVASNLTDMAFKLSEVDAMAFFDTRGGLVYAMSYGPDRKIERILPPGLSQHLTRESILLTHKSEKSFITGIVMLSEGPALVGSRPVVPGNGEGPIGGTVVFMSLLDAKEVKRLSDITRVSLDLLKLDAPSLPPDFSVARAAFLGGKEKFVKVLDNNTIAGYAVLKDLYEKPVLILKVAMSREITQFGRRILIYFFVVLVVAGCLLGAMVYIPLEKEILWRDRSEKMLGISEKQYRDLFNNTREGIAVYAAQNNGEDFFFVDINQAGERISQVRREDALGKSVLGLFPGIKASGLFEVFQKVWRSGEPQRHPSVFYQDKRISQWVENFVYKLPSGDIVAVYDDVTEARKAEEERQATLLRVQYLSKYANDFIILLDKNFNFLETNDRTVDFYGYTREELIGMNATQLRAPEAKQEFREQVKPAKEGGSALYETVHQKKDGTQFPVEISIRAFDAGGERRYQAIIRDISERRKTDETTRKQLRELEVVYQASLGREARILELKKKIEELEARLKQ